MGDWILDANDKMVWDANLPGKKRGERVPSRATPEMIAAIEAKNAEAKAIHDAKVAEEEKAKALSESVNTPLEKLKTAWEKWSE